jgi:hypothetical protein
VAVTDDEVCGSRLRAAISLQLSAPWLGLSAKRKPPGRRLGRAKSDDDQIIVSASRRLPFSLFKNLVVIANHLGSDPHRVFDEGL